MTAHERKYVMWLIDYCRSGLESAEDRAFLRACGGAKKMLRRWIAKDRERREAERVARLERGERRALATIERHRTAATKRRRTGERID